MDSINSLSSSMVQKNIMEAFDKIGGHNNVKPGGMKNSIEDIGAYSIAPGMMNNAFNFDALSDRMVNFSDKLGTAQDAMSLMRAQGEALLNLINRAHEDGHSREEIDEMNTEAASRVAEINKLFENAQFGGINPLRTPFDLTIPDWQNVIQQFSGVENPENVEETSQESAISNLIADIDFNFDLSADFGGSSLNMAASASIKIGFTDEGALQITVDASLDFDLSGIVEKGVQSDDSYDLINNFLSLLDGKQNDMSAASQLLDKILGFAGFSVEDFIPETDSNSPSNVQGKITQQATITLDGAANQMPNIAINLL